MKHLRLVVWCLNWVVALACGTVGVIWYLEKSATEGRELSAWLQKVTDNPTYGLALFLVALATVVLNLVYFMLRHVVGRDMRTHIPVKGSDANITVSLYALRHALIRTLEKEPEVHSVDVEIRHDRRKNCITHVLARGTIWDGPDIMLTTIRLQNKLRGRFHEIVEPEEEPTFEVKLDSFRFVGKQRGFRERIDRIKESFRGPQYPIGG
jgi:hypothetical protein